MISALLASDSYASFKELLNQSSAVPDIVEETTHFALTHYSSGIIYHRHILKDTVESSDLLDDFWPAVSAEDKLEYGTYALTGTTTFANRKEVCAIAPQQGRTLAVSSKTTTTLTFPTNTFYRANFAAITLNTPTTQGARLTVGSNNRSFTANDVGLRLVIEESGQDPTYCYICEYVDATNVLIDGTLQGTYSVAATVREHILGRYVILRPTIGIARYRVASYSADTITLSTTLLLDGVGADSLPITEANVRLTDEYISVKQLILSGLTADCMIAIEHKDTALYGNTNFNTIGRLYYAITGGTQQIALPLALHGNNTDMLKISIYNVSNTNGVLHASILAGLKA